ncbi:hypothetical protein QFC19_009467 [Naganishia cerealis]|uniref:Uncharacterized protein n=1 Tax=Naganishia cerealis TaxID=610337 RepID=A0ACC2UUX7_9TREE|nr:hypothetical protein QFC19_009467 [Naganishia cerealis]
MRGTGVAERTDTGVAPRPWLQGPFATSPAGGTATPSTTGTSSTTAAATRRANSPVVEIPTVNERTPVSVPNRRRRRFVVSVGGDVIDLLPRSEFPTPAEAAHQERLQQMAEEASIFTTATATTNNTVTRLNDRLEIARGNMAMLALARSSLRSFEYGEELMGGRSGGVGEVRPRRAGTSAGYWVRWVCEQDPAAPAQASGLRLRSLDMTRLPRIAAFDFTISPPDDDAFIRADEIEFITPRTRLRPTIGPWMHSRVRIEPFENDPESATWGTSAHVRQACARDRLPTTAAATNDDDDDNNTNDNRY